MKERQREVQLYRGQIPSPGRPTVAWRADRVRFWVRNRETLQTLSAAFDSSRENQIEVKLNQEKAILRVNGKAAATLDQKAFLIAQPQDGLDIGIDKGGIVGPYKADNRFSGTIHSIELDLK